MVFVEIIAVGSFIVGTICAYYAYKQHKQNKELADKNQKLKGEIKQINNYIGVNVTIKEIPESNDELKKESKKRFFIKEQLIQEEVPIFSPGAKFNRLMERLKDFISDQDKDIFLSASAICKMDLEGKGNIASQMLKSFYKKYELDNLKERAKHIYNNLNSNSFEENLIPYLDELQRYLPKNDPNIKKLFLDYYENLLKFVVNRIWVTEMDDYDHIKNNIEKRFKQFKSLEILYIFARSPLRVKVTEVACKYFVKKNPREFGWDSKERKVLGKIARDFRIIRK